MPRQVHKDIIKLPSMLQNKVQEQNPLFREMSHIPGQTAAIRFFDEKSKEDFAAMNDILRAKQVKNWMDDAGRISWHDYQYWAGKHTNQSFLFAVHDSRLSKKSQFKIVRGFVNIYSERGEKLRAKRLTEAGIINKSVKYTLEVSMALRPLKNGEISGSGIMSSALRQSCLQVKSWFTVQKLQSPVIFAFIDPDNPASVRVVEAAGFVKKGQMKYDSTSPDDSYVYVLSWPKLQRKVTDSLDKAIRISKKIITEPQITDMHCGPAVAKAFLEFNNVKVTQEDVVNAVNIRSKIREYGMNPAQIALAVKVLAPGLKFWFKQHTTAGDLEKLIHTYKCPVGVNWQGLFYNSVMEEKLKNKSKDDGHYSIVVDIDLKNDRIVIDDPYSEYFAVPRTFSFKWFKTRWWDQAKQPEKISGSEKIIETKKLIFIIAPATAEFPEKLSLKGADALVELEKTA